MPRSRPHIVLVPGFFGFANLGEIRYFGHVGRVLLETGERAGRAPHVHVVHTHPTASLVSRARQLYEAIAENLAYCLTRGWGEKPSPSGDDFSLILCDARVQKAGWVQVAKKKYTVRSLEP